MDYNNINFSNMTQSDILNTKIILSKIQLTSQPFNTKNNTILNIKTHMHLKRFLKKVESILNIQFKFDFDCDNNTDFWMCHFNTIHNLDNIMDTQCIYNLHVFILNNGEFELEGIELNTQDCLIRHSSEDDVYSLDIDIQEMNIEIMYKLHSFKKLLQHYKDTSNNTLKHIIQLQKRLKDNCVLTEIGEIDNELQQSKERFFNDIKTC